MASNHDTHLMFWLWSLCTLAIIDWFIVSGHSMSFSCISPTSCVHIFLPVGGKNVSLRHCHPCLNAYVWIFCHWPLLYCACMCVWHFFVFVFLSLFLFLAVLGVSSGLLFPVVTLSYRTQSCLTPSASYSLHGYLSQSSFQASDFGIYIQKLFQNKTTGYLLFNSKKKKLNTKIQDTNDIIGII